MGRVTERTQPAGKIVRSGIPVADVLGPTLRIPIGIHPVGFDTQLGRLPNDRQLVAFRGRLVTAIDGARRIVADRRRCRLAIRRCT